MLTTAETTPPPQRDAKSHGRDAKSHASCRCCGHATPRAELDACKGHCRTCYWWVSPGASMDRLEEELARMR